MRSFLFTALLGLFTLASSPGCTIQESPDVPTLDTSGLDAPVRDVPAVTCTTAAECNDDLPCTFDDCVVGNVCSHMPLDTLCGSGERCDLVMGCTSGCTSAADCNTGINYCDGTFACAGGRCLPAEARNCDDGNDCTIDTCDPSVVNGDVMGGCTYALATGCDGGMGSGDAGLPTCDPFDPATGYTGTFRVAPMLSLDCTVDYSIATFAFSTSGGMLRVTGAPTFAATMTGAIPTDASFTVTGTAGCGTYTLTGMFVCANRFQGTFTTSFSAGCAICGGGTTSIVGRI